MTEFFEIVFAFDFPAYLSRKIWASFIILNIFAMLTFIVSFHEISRQTYLTEGIVWPKPSRN